MTCDGRNDVKDYNDIISAMKVLTYTDEEIWMLHKIVAALLHIGNITYRGRSWARHYKRFLSKSRCSTHNQCSEMT